MDIAAIEASSCTLAHIPNPIMQRDNTLNGVRVWKQSIQKIGGRRLLIYRSKILQRLVWTISARTLENWLYIDSYDEAKEQKDDDYAGSIHDFLIKPYEHYADLMNHKKPLKKRIHDSATLEGDASKKRKKKHKKDKKDPDKPADDHAPAAAFTATISSSISPGASASPIAPSAPIAPAASTAASPIAPAASTAALPIAPAASAAASSTAAASVSTTTPATASPSYLSRANIFGEDSDDDEASSDAAKTLSIQAQATLDANIFGEDSDDAASSDAAKTLSIQATLDAHHKRVLDKCIVQAEQLVATFESGSKANRVRQNPYEMLLLKSTEAYCASERRKHFQQNIPIAIPMIDLTLYDDILCTRKCEDLVRLAETFTGLQYADTSELYVKPSLLKRWLELSKERKYTHMRLVLFGGTEDDFDKVQQHPFGFRALNEYYLALSSPKSDKLNSIIRNGACKPGRAILALMLCHESDLFVDGISLDVCSSKQVATESIVTDCLKVTESDILLVLGHIDPV